MRHILIIVAVLFSTLSGAETYLTIVINNTNDERPTTIKSKMPDFELA